MRLLRFHSHQNYSNNNKETNQIINAPPIYSLSSNNSTESSSSPSSICQANNQELLDMILLAFGMTGEMIYSVAGLLGLTGDPNWQPLTIILLAVHVTRIIEGKLRVGNDPILRERQPGKQAITFLLLANISMFLMNLLEAEKAGVSETVVNFYGKRSWVFLVRSFSPLTIFYRFHSSVCLAEVWKTTYSWKE
uniref:Transmembrane protein 107 n=1 Tax=Meloidogyne floridensis TaxID=298350 RepID=A0A915PA19_9BILA